MAWLVKFFAPLLLFAAAGSLILSGQPGFSMLVYRILFQLPLLLLGLFLLSLVEVKVSEAGLQYLRFFHWHRISWDTVRRYGKSWMPGISFVRTRVFIAPWGSIYFIALRPLVGGRETFFFSRLDVTAGGKQEPMVMAKKAVKHPDRYPRFCVIMGLTGFLIFLAAGFFIGKSPNQTDLSSLPHWIAVASTLWGRLLRWPWVFIPSVFLLLEVWRRGFRNDAWLASFLFGSLWGFAAAQMLR